MALRPTAPDAARSSIGSAEIDREAAQLLSVELAAHVRSNRFPLDISD